MDTTVSNTTKLFSQSISHLLLICPYCVKDIPEIALFPNKTQMHITVKCSCLPQSIFITLTQFLDQLSKINPEPKKSDKCFQDKNKAEKYCPQCLMWLCNQCIESHDKNHCLIDHQINMKCFTHKKQFSMYCNQCKRNICNSCKLSHTKRTHCFIDIPKVKQALIDLNEIEQFLSNNKENIDDLLSGIDKSNSISNQMKKEMHSIYNHYNDTNQKLKELYQRLYSTAILFKDISLYQINQMINTIKVNKTMCCLNKLNIVEKYEILKPYMQSYFLLSPNKEKTSNYCHSTLTGSNYPMRNLIQLASNSLESDSNNSSTQLRDTNINECTYTYYGINQNPHLIQLSESKIIANVNKHYLKIWDINNYECTNSVFDFYTTSRDCIQLFDIKLALSSGSKQVKLWDVSRHTYTTFSTTNVIMSMDYLQLLDGRIAIGVENCSIELWNISTKKCSAILIGHVNYVTKIIQLLNGQLVSSSFDWTIKLWDITKKTDQCIITLKGHRHYITNIILLSDGSLASASMDTTIKLWDLTEGGQCITTIRLDEHIFDLIQLDDGRIAFSHSCITLWDAKRLKSLKRFKQNNYERIDWFIQLKDGRLASSTSFNPYIKLWLV